MSERSSEVWDTRNTEESVKLLRMAASKKEKGGRAGLQPMRTHNPLSRVSRLDHEPTRFDSS